MQYKIFFVKVSRRKISLSLSPSIVFVFSPYSFPFFSFSVNDVTRYWMGGFIVGEDERLIMPPPQTGLEDAAMCESGTDFK